MRRIPNGQASRICPGAQLEADDGQEARKLDNRDTRRFGPFNPSDLRARRPRRARHHRLAEPVILAALPYLGTEVTDDRPRLRRAQVDRTHLCGHRGLAWQVAIMRPLRDDQLVAQGRDGALAVASIRRKAGQTAVKSNRRHTPGSSSQKLPIGWAYPTRVLTRPSWKRLDCPNLRALLTSGTRVRMVERQNGRSCREIRASPTPGCDSGPQHVTYAPHVDSLTLVERLMRLLYPQPGRIDGCLGGQLLLPPRRHSRAPLSGATHRRHSPLPQRRRSSAAPLAGPTLGRHSPGPRLTPDSP